MISQNAEMINMLVDIRKSQDDLHVKFFQLTEYIPESLRPMVLTPVGAASIPTSSVVTPVSRIATDHTSPNNTTIPSPVLHPPATLLA